MRVRVQFAAVLVCALLGAACSLWSPAVKAPVGDLVLQLPGENAAATEKILAAILKMGPDGIRTICATLLPPGTSDDTKARYALDGLALYASKRTSQRKTAARAFCDAAASASDKEVQAFLLERIQQVGGNESVASLARFLGDEKLCDPAAQALVAIGTPRASDALAKALPKAQGSRRVTIIQALGALRNEAAVPAILPDATSKDAATRGAALYALANMGAPSAAGAIQRAADARDPYERAKATSWYLLYARRLAEEGKKEQAAAICRSLIQSREEDQVRCAALDLLVEIEGAKAKNDVLAAMDDGNVRFRAKALALAAQSGAQSAAQSGAQPAAPKKESPAEIPAPSLNAKDSEGVTAPPEGFVALFNGKDLTGWKGLLAKPNDNPIKRAALTPEESAAAQTLADEEMRAHWKAESGILVFDGKGRSICAARDYADFEMLVDWKITPGGDSGIYLRGSPQVQIWDTARIASGAEVGSGGLYNNKENPSKPLKPADKPVGEWNTFRIKMVGDRVTVHLNGELVVDNVILENYWDRAQPIFPAGQIELQNHGTPLYFRNIFIRDIPRKGEWRPLFNGRDLAGWVGDTGNYSVEKGDLVCGASAKNLFSEEEFGDFRVQFEFQLSPNANNGLAIRSPLQGNPAYDGMEIQILDDSGDKYKTLQPYQYHGSIYGVVPAKHGFLKPVGEWNTEEVIAKGKRIQVILNGEKIVDADIEKASAPETLDGKPHPGLKREKGHIGFLGHGAGVRVRNIRVMENLK